MSEIEKKALEPESVMAKLKSRKLWMAVITQILVIFVVAFLDVPEEQATEIVTWIVGTAATYILGQSYTDGQKEKSRAEIVKNAGVRE